MFNCDNSCFFHNGVVALDGPAGSGKSTGVYNTYRENDKLDEVTFTTSTRNLAHKMQERLGIPCYTSASALFYNDPHFYASFKELPENRVFVIDEILQGDPRIFDLINEYKDRDLFITLTDTAQCLSPNGEKMINGYNNMLKDATCITLTETHRAQDEETKEMFYSFRERSLNDELTNPQTLEEFFPVVEYDDMPYNPEDCYITPANDIEAFFYKDRQLNKRDDLPLLMKGMGAHNAKDLSRYALKPQKYSNGLTQYTQVANVGSAYRMQGIELEDEQTLYFMVDPTKLIHFSNIYTACSRVRHMSQIRIVYVVPSTEVTLTQYNGKPVKRLATFFEDERGIDTQRGMTPKAIDQFLSEHDTPEVFYDRNVVMGTDGIATKFNRDTYDTNRRIYCPPTPERRAKWIVAPEEHKKRTTLRTLLKRDSLLSFTFVEELYSVLSGRGVEKISAPRVPFRRDGSPFQVDLRSAYYSILAHDNMPCEGRIKTDEPHPEMLNFYKYEGDYIRQNSFVTDDLARYIVENKLGTVTYMFSTEKTKGNLTGEALYNKVTKSKEDKDECKEIARWGILERPFLSYNRDHDIYIKEPHNVYEILFVAIYSQLTFYALQLKDVLNGTQIVVDAVFFMEYNDSVVEKIKSVLPDWLDFRVLTGNDKDKSYYKSYDALPTKEEVKKAQARERARRYREKKRKEQIQNG